MGGMSNMTKHNKTRDAASELITKTELAKRLKLCTRKIELMVNCGEIPVVRIGSSVRFNWLKVLTALEEE